MKTYLAVLVLLVSCCISVKAELSIAYNAMENYDGNSYYYVVTPTETSYYWLDFNEAEQECVTWGGHLASVHSQEEFDFIVNLVTWKALTYIGEDTGTWTDGTPNDFSTWKTEIAPHARITGSTNYSLPAFVCKKEYLQGQLNSAALKIVENVCGTSNDDCSKDATCSNTGSGTYKCSCNSGYTGDGKTCEEIKVCGTNEDDCSNYATCSNTGPGTYKCSCNSGYTGDGKTCEEIKVCGTNEDDCSNYATCSNTGPGTYKCSCNSGYTGDGKTCEEIKVCGTNEDDCSNYATCSNTGPGTYKCTCNSGYTGDGKTCGEIKVCGTNEDDCSNYATCSNTGPGTYKCTCNSGYTGDGQTCSVQTDYVKTVNYNGYYYRYVVTFTSVRYFSDAEKECVKWGGHLASIHSKQELDYIKKLVTKSYKTFIGYDINKWTDGTPYDYTDWRKNLGSLLTYRFLSFYNPKYSAFVCKKKCKYTRKIFSFTICTSSSWNGVKFPGR